MQRHSTCQSTSDTGGSILSVEACSHGVWQLAHDRMLWHFDCISSTSGILPPTESSIDLADQLSGRLTATRHAFGSFFE